ncbi:MAG: metallophosphoesterase [Pirellulaceae bacterium]
MPNWTRRKWIAAATATSAIALPLYARFLEPHWLQVIQHTLPIRNLPPHWHGKTILHASDLHIGPPVDDQYLQRVFALIESLQPDLIVYTGDFVSHSTQLDDPHSQSLDRLPLGRIATLGILGNHDYGPTWKDAARAQELVDRLEAQGLRMLRNTQVQLDGLHLLGIEELWSGQLDLKTAIDGWQQDWPGLALIHNPDIVDLSGWSNFHGWILAGHTHGGQVKPPFLPPPVLPLKNRRYTSGIFSITPERTLFISRGVGYLAPVRFNARPDITLFRLAPAPPVA